MDTLEVRRIKFNLNGVKFIWNPHNPRFSVFINQLSFWIVALEKYFCRAVAAAEPLIQDDLLKTEARLFVQQEAMHSLAHQQHVKGLVAQYPELQGTLKRVIQHYDDLYQRESLHYHLAYLAGEAAFAPVFALYIQNRDVLFRLGDTRVSSLCLWHFFEEIEHRSTGLSLYNHLVGKTGWRIKQLPSMLRHINQAFALIESDFKQFVPQEDWGGPDIASDPFSGIGAASRFKCALGIIKAHMPGHNPERFAVPAWNREWLDDYNAGGDMSRYFGDASQTQSNDMSSRAS